MGGKEMNYTVDDRFQVTCSICGYLVGERSLGEAIHTANFANMKHNSENEHIEIYDIMAHIGKPELYDVDGEVIRIRTK